MEYCDIVKQSASATRGTAFIIDVQGGNSGYIATFASLISGAQASYVPEEGISLQQLEMDINSLREAFAVEQGMTKSGKLIIKSSNASKVLTHTHWLTYSTMNVTVTLTLRQLFRDTSNKVDYLHQ